MKALADFRKIARIKTHFNLIEGHMGFGKKIPGQEASGLLFHRLRDRWLGLETVPRSLHDPGGEGNRVQGLILQWERGVLLGDLVAFSQNTFGFEVNHSRGVGKMERISRTGP